MRPSSALLGRLLSVNPAKLEGEYRSRELYRGERVEPPLALRLDGVGWGRRLASRYSRPRDWRVHRALVEAARRLVELLGGCCAYTASDEVNLIIASTPPYGGRVEKLVSISSGIASSTVSLQLGESLFFDSRIVKLYGAADAERYLLYRARVAFNNYIATLYHTVGLGEPTHTPSLPEMLEKLRGEGVDIGPAWAYAGTCIAYVEAERIADGVRAIRRRLIAVDAGLDLCSRAARRALAAGQG